MSDGQLGSILKLLDALITIRPDDVQLVASVGYSDVRRGWRVLAFRCDQRDDPAEYRTSRAERCHDGNRQCNYPDEELHG